MSLRMCLVLLAIVAFAAALPTPTTDETLQAEESRWGRHGWGGGYGHGNWDGYGYGHHGHGGYGDWGNRGYGYGGYGGYGVYGGYGGYERYGVPIGIGIGYGNIW